MGKEPILLGFVKTMDFINEKQRALSVLPPQFGGLKDFAQVGHAGKNGTDLHEGEVRFIGQKPRDGGFAHTWRAPKNQRRKVSMQQHLP